MFKLNQHLLDTIEKENLLASLFKGKFGFEKENIRVNKMGEMSLKPHPKTFGDKSSNPYITTDFSESQVEMITPPMNTIDEAYNMLDTLHNIVSVSLEEELLWPQSLPPILPKDDLIPIAKFESDHEKNDYRETLAKKYGKKKQLISGIHYNFSFEYDFLQQVHKNMYGEMTYKAFRNQFYLNTIRNIVKHGWFLIKLLGSSPSLHESYSKECLASESSTSIRNGDCGYNNLTDIYVPLDHLSNYVETIDDLVKSNVLTSPKEYYSIVRPKNKSGRHDLLNETGIEYLELRLLDLNPLFKLGISKTDLYFIHLFIMMMALLEDQPFDQSTFKEAMYNNKLIADKGRNQTLKIMSDGIKRDEMQSSWDLFVQINKLSKMNDQYADVIVDLEYRLMNRENLYSEIIYNEIIDKNFIDYHLNKAEDYLEESKKVMFNVTGYEDMELSTQILILDAIRRGVRVEILDRYENFIRLSNKNKSEIIKQATKTSMDNYSSVLVMENKAVTKKVLQAASINTPGGGIYEDFESALSHYEKYADKKIVVKPNSTNYGIGITILKSDFTLDQYEEALKIAFDHDQTILVEFFVDGKEYRIFVIVNDVVAAMHRVPANVIGDGLKSIRELVEEKNKSPIRGTKYRKPLQIINLDHEAAIFLKQQGLTFDYVPGDQQTVFLRENSNISTGGDSIDVSDIISERYKALAVAAAQSVGASITGVDLITRDIESEEALPFSIIEMNFNPAIHIHCYPYKGENRYLGDKILDHLGF